eukprot:gene5619-4038_t
MSHRPVLLVVFKEQNSSNGRFLSRAGEMFKGLGSVPAVNPQPSIPRTNHRVWFLLIIYLNCLLLVGCGGVAFFFSCIHYKYLIHCFVSVYMVIFGIIAALTDLRLGFAERAFGFACSPKGLGFLFIFAGTLGISFGISKSIDELLPFSCGIVSVLVGIGSLFEEPREQPGRVESIPTPQRHDNHSPAVLQNTTVGKYLSRVVHAEHKWCSSLTLAVNDHSAALSCHCFSYWCSPIEPVLCRLSSPVSSMFEGNPIARSAGVKVMVWANCAVLIFSGFFGFIGNIFNFLNLTYPILAAYVLLFGLVATAVEVNLGFVTKSFGILTDWLGSAIYFMGHLLIHRRRRMHHRPLRLLLEYGPGHHSTCLSSSGPLEAYLTAHSPPSRAAPYRKVEYEHGLTVGIGETTPLVTVSVFTLVPLGLTCLSSSSVCCSFIALLVHPNTNTSSTTFLRREQPPATPPLPDMDHPLLTTSPLFLMILHAQTKKNKQTNNNNNNKQQQQQRIGYTHTTFSHTLRTSISSPLGIPQTSILLPGPQPHLLNASKNSYSHPPAPTTHRRQLHLLYRATLRCTSKSSPQKPFDQGANTDECCACPGTAHSEGCATTTTTAASEECCACSGAARSEGSATTTTTTTTTAAAASEECCACPGAAHSEGCATTTASASEECCACPGAAHSEGCATTTTTTASEECCACPGAAHSEGCATTTTTASEECCACPGAAHSEGCATTTTTAAASEECCACPGAAHSEGCATTTTTASEECCACPGAAHSEGCATTTTTASASEECCACPGAAHSEGCATTTTATTSAAASEECCACPGAAHSEGCATTTTTAAASEECCACPGAAHSEGCATTTTTASEECCACPGAAHSEGCATTTTTASASEECCACPGAAHCEGCATTTAASEECCACPGAAHSEGCATTITAASEECCACPGAAHSEGCATTTTATTSAAASEECCACPGAAHSEGCATTTTTASEECCACPGAAHSEGCATTTTTAAASEECCACPGAAHSEGCATTTTAASEECCACPGAAHSEGCATTTTAASEECCACPGAAHSEGCATTTTASASEECCACPGAARSEGCATTTTTASASEECCACPGAAHSEGCATTTSAAASEECCACPGATHSEGCATTTTASASEECCACPGAAHSEGCATTTTAASEECCACPGATHSEGCATTTTASASEECCACPGAAHSEGCATTTSAAASEECCACPGATHSEGCATTTTASASEECCACPGAARSEGCATTTTASASTTTAASNGSWKWAVIASGANLFYFVAYVYCGWWQRWGGRWQMNELSCRRAASVETGAWPLLALIGPDGWEDAAKAEEAAAAPALKTITVSLDSTFGAATRELCEGWAAVEAWAEEVMADGGRPVLRLTHLENVGFFDAAEGVAWLDPGDDARRHCESKQQMLLERVRAAAGRGLVIEAAVHPSAPLLDFGLELYLACSPGGATPSAWPAGSGFPSISCGVFPAASTVRLLRPVLGVAGCLTQVPRLHQAAALPREGGSLPVSPATSAGRGSAFRISSAPWALPASHCPPGAMARWQPYALAALSGGGEGSVPTTAPSRAPALLRGSAVTTTAQQRWAQLELLTRPESTSRLVLLSAGEDWTARCAAEGTDSTTLVLDCRSSRATSGSRSPSAAAFAAACAAGDVPMPPRLPGVLVGSVWETDPLLRCFQAVSVLTPLPHFPLCGRTDVWQLRVMAPGESSARELLLAALQHAPTHAQSGQHCLVIAVRGAAYERLLAALWEATLQLLSSSHLCSGARVEEAGVSLLGMRVGPLGLLDLYGHAPATAMLHAAASTGTGPLGSSSWAAGGLSPTAQLLRLQRDAGLHTALCDEAGVPCEELVDLYLRRPLTVTEVGDCLLGALANSAAALLAEGAVLCAADLNALSVAALGLQESTGGLLALLGERLRAEDGFDKRLQDRWGWRGHPLLSEAAASDLPMDKWADEVLARQAAGNLVQDGRRATGAGKTVPVASVCSILIGIAMKGCSPHRYNILALVALPLLLHFFFRIIIIIFNCLCWTACKRSVSLVFPTHRGVSNNCHCGRAPVPSPTSPASLRRSYLEQHCSAGPFFPFMDSKQQGSQPGRQLTTRDDYPHSRYASQRYPLRRDVIECFAVPKGVQDGLAHLGLDMSPYDYLAGGEDCIRSFCSSIPIPFHVFNGIRKSKGKVELSTLQKDNVYKAFDKLVEGDGGKDCKEISTALPFVSAFFYQRCPDLQRAETQSSEGATYLLLAVITGDTELCRRCLDAGANPNNMSFLREENDGGSDMYHGYSPMFMAVLAEQIEIMDMLSAAGGIVHVYDRWGRTPLHAAVAMNNEEVVVWLLEKGAPRYVGDCLNILPAESAEVDYFPEIAMPNPALCGLPKKPSIKYFAKLIEGPRVPGAHHSGASDALDEESDIECCHCISERPKGFCGCVDDMFYRWSMDRLGAMWNPGVDFFALAQRPPHLAPSPLTHLHIRLYPFLLVVVVVSVLLLPLLHERTNLSFFTSCLPLDPLLVALMYSTAPQKRGNTVPSLPKIEEEDKYSGVRTPVSEIDDIEVEPPIEHKMGLYTAISSYFTLTLLTTLSNIREGYRRLFPQKSVLKRPGYAPLVTSFDDLWQRRFYRRIRDLWNRPIDSRPSRIIGVMERVSHDCNLTFQCTGRIIPAINLGSYNYLGFAEDTPSITYDVLDSIDDFGIASCSAAMEAGQHTPVAALEKEFAAYLGKEDAIICGMGFGTNFRGIPTLFGKGSLAVSDSINHSSLVNGVRSSGASVRVWSHGKYDELETLLQEAIVLGQNPKGPYVPYTRIVIVVEGVYSMEGEIIDLKKMVAIKNKYKCLLFVDEAHSIGALGRTGRGVCEHCGVSPKDVDVLMGTFTKSFGSIGGYIAADKRVVDWLRLHSTISLHCDSLAAPCSQQILSVLHVLLGKTGNDLGRKRLQQLRENCRFFRQGLIDLDLVVMGDDASPVVPVMVYNLGLLAPLSRRCLERGVAIVVVGYPATPLLMSRIRFCVSACHTREDLQYVLDVMREVTEDFDIAFNKGFKKRMLAHIRSLSQLSIGSQAIVRTDDAMGGTHAHRDDLQAALPFSTTSVATTPHLTSIHIFSICFVFMFSVLTRVREPCRVYKIHHPPLIIVPSTAEPVGRGEERRGGAGSEGGRQRVGTTNRDGHMDYPKLLYFAFYDLTGPASTARRNENEMETEGERDVDFSAPMPSLSQVPWGGIAAGAAAATAAGVTAAAMFARQRVPRWDMETTSVLVTGGSTGIGMETAKALVRRRVQHVVIAARREAVLKTTVAALEEEKKAAGSSTAVHYVVMDVCSDKSVAEAVAAARQACGGSISLVICCAGFATPRRFLDSAMRDAEGMMQTNYFGCLRVMWAVLPDMVARRRGRIVLTSSLAALAPIAGYSLYAGTKAGLRATAHCVDMEHSCLGVRVQVISPPDVETPGFDTENEVKSPECRAISELGGASPFTAESMAAAIIKGIEHYRFDITLGLDGAALQHARACMEPPTSVGGLLLETTCGGILRLVLAVYSKLHYNIVHRIRTAELAPGATSKKNQ